MTKSKAKEIAALKKKIAAVEAKQAKKKVMPVDAAGNPPSDAALRRMEKAKAKPVDTTNLTPRIEAGYFLQGPVRFAVDTDNLDRTISCGAFGPGQAQEKFGVLLNLGEAELTRWGQLNHFTVKPFVRELLCEVLRGILQDAWFAACYDVVKTPGLVDNPARRAQYHQARVANYERRLKAFTVMHAVRVEKMKASGTQHVFVKQPERAWRATAKLTKKIVDAVKGQQAPILAWLFKNSGTKSEIAAAVGSKLATKQGPEKVVGHYLPQWAKAGWIEQ